MKLAVRLCVVLTGVFVMQPKKSRVHGDCMSVPDDVVDARLKQGAQLSQRNRATLCII